MWASFSIDFLSEVFVVRDQNPVFIEGFLDNCFIIGATSFVIDRKDLVPLVT
jgi:hypothetical protein